MSALDFRTVLTSHLIATGLSTVVITWLWRRDRERFDGLGLWALHFATQFVALLLIALRGSIPDLFSMVLSNALIVVGLIALLVGLERYVNRVRSQLHNYVFLTLFVLVHSYFTFIRPDLVARTINGSVALVFLCLQAAWLLWRRVDDETRSDVRVVMFVFVLYALAAMFRIGVDVSSPRINDMFQSGLYDTLVLLSYQMLQIGLTFALVLTVNNRLVSALERDIRERTIAEEALRLSQEKYSIAFENIPDAIVVTEMSDGRIIEANQSFQELGGHTKAEAIGKTTLELNLWADPSDRAAMVEQLRETGRVTGLETKFRTKSGRVLDAVISSEVIHMHGEPRILTVIHDETERKAIRTALAFSEAKFATAFRTSPDAVNINRLSDGLYMDINEGFTKLTGYTADDVAGRTSRDINIWDDMGDRDRLVEGLRADGVVHNLEARFRRKDGSSTTALMSAQVVDVGGEQCILSVTRDISDRKRTEEEILRLNEGLELRVQERTEQLTAANEELTEANTRLEEATRAKSDFLAAMSHELRTPLNSVIGFSDILVKGMAGELTPEQEKQVRMINSSGKYLLELVNEVLDLSAIETGRMRIDRKPMDVVAVVRSVVDSLEPLADGKGLDLSWEVAPEAALLVSDRTRLEQVLFNIIGNAIKFTDAGSVRVEVRHIADETVFAITDTGCGIAEDEKTRIFDEFHQVERHDVAKSDGTGLGLTVSERLIGMLGGTISVESELGKGSVFLIRLPARS